MRGFLSKHDIAKLLTGIFTLPLYQKIHLPISPSHSSCLVYTENQAFWQDAIAKKHFDTLRVQLQGFILTEWLPLAPGRYFTETALVSREQAASDLDVTGYEYGLYGKHSMIQGGIGSLRLAAKFIDGNKRYFLGATSTGVSHEGIPIALTETDYQRIIPLIHRNGGCRVDLEGTLQFLPTPINSLSPRVVLTYDPEVPNYCLVIEKLQLLQPRQLFGDNLIVTAAIAFASSSSIPRSPLPKEWSWTYYSFHPHDLNQAVQKLQNYVTRYSRRDTPLILADFDEHYQHFLQPFAVEFPVEQITTHAFDTAKARRYQDRYLDTFRAITHRNSHFLSNDTFYSFKKPRNKPVSTFMCFAPPDKSLASIFKEHLWLLQSRGDIDIRWRDDILAGEGIEIALDHEIEQAQLILFLLSSDLLNDLFYQKLALQALERHKQGDVKALLIYLRPVYYEGSSFAELPLLPSNSVPVRDASWFSIDSAFESITRDLVPIIRKIPDKV